MPETVRGLNKSGRDILRCLYDRVGQKIGLRHDVPSLLNTQVWLWNHLQPLLCTNAGITEITPDRTHSFLREAVVSGCIHRYGVQTTTLQSAAQSNPNATVTKNARIRITWYTKSEAREWRCRWVKKSDYGSGILYARFELSAYFCPSHVLAEIPTYLIRL